MFHWFFLLIFHWTPGKAPVATPKQNGKAAAKAEESSEEESDDDSDEEEEPAKPAAVKGNYHVLSFCIKTLFKLKRFDWSSFHLYLRL